MRRLLTITFALLVGGLLLAPPAAATTTTPRAHKFYVSFTRIEHNRERQTAEISIRTFADDLEAALSKRTGRRVYLDSTKDSSALVFGYVRDSLQLTGRDGKLPVTLKWVGMETNVDSVWIYLESPMPDGFDGASVRQRLLFDLFKEQVNTVNVIDAERRADLVFKRDDSAAKPVWSGAKQ